MLFKTQPMLRYRHNRCLDNQKYFTYEIQDVSRHHISSSASMKMAIRGFIDKMGKTASGKNKWEIRKSKLCFPLFGGIFPYIGIYTYYPIEGLPVS